MLQPGIGVEARGLLLQSARQGDVIGIEKGHQGRAGGSPAAVASAGHPQARQTEQPHGLALACRPLVHKCGRVVLAAIVNGQQFPVALLLMGEGVEAGR